MSKIKASVLALAAVVCAFGQLSLAQSPMSASAGLGPDNTFTLFVTFQESMPKIDGVGCGFNLDGSPKPGQENFVVVFNCTGSVKKVDDTHYSAEVQIPGAIAAGDYKINFLTVYIGGANHRYDGQNIPNLAPVKINNPDHLKFSSIKDLGYKP